MFTRYHQRLLMQGERTKKEWPRSVALLLCGLIVSFSAVSIDCNIDPKASYSQLKRLELSCADQPGYNYLLGLSAMQNKEYYLAIEAFERVTRQSPRHAGVLLDLAEIYYRLADKQKVASLIKKLETEYDLPKLVQQLVGRYKEWLDQPVAEPMQVVNSAQIEIDRGYGSNINGGSSNDTINLVGFDLRLTGDSLPRADGFTSFTLQLSQQKSLNDWQLNGSFVAQKLKYDTYHQYDNEWAMIGLTAQRPITQKHQLVLSGYTLWLNSHNASDQNNFWLQAKISQSLGRNKRVGYWINGQRVEAERQQDESRRYKTGVEFNQVIGSHYSYISLEIGRDEPVGKRLGGRRHLINTKIGLLSQLGQVETKLQLQYRLEQDRHAYDNALFEKRRRNRKQLWLVASAGYNINKQQKITVWTDYIKERSEIKLFETRGWRAGLRWQFGW